MIVFFDDDGRMIGSLDSGYPAPAEQVGAVRGHYKTTLDVPPLLPGFWYARDGRLEIRPRLDLDVRQDGRVATINGIPAGTMVTVTGPYQGMQEADGGSFEIEFNQAGDYVVTFESFPHVAETLTFTVA